jgi:hypothetical protein
MQNVVGMFDTRAQAERAIHRLKTGGVDIDAISVAMKDEAELSDLSEFTGAKDLSGEGATAGAMSGAAVGTLIGLAIAGTTLVLPGLGTFLVGGPLAAALAGAGLGAASGGALGALIGAGIPETEAQQFATGLEAGQIIVVAAVSDEKAIKVRSIFLEEGSLHTLTA